MDRIIVSGAHLSVHLGVPPHERSIAQEIVVDLEVEFDTARAGSTDHFADTIDYAAIHETARLTATAHTYSLVESMAARIAQAVLDQHAAAAVRVLIRKPAALRDRGVDWAGVEITRRRP